MLKRKHGRCPCHAGQKTERLYYWYGLLYCLPCLHSIGVNAAGNPCTKTQYTAAWREMAGIEKPEAGAA